MPSSSPSHPGFPRVSGLIFVLVLSRASCPGEPCGKELFPVSLEVSLYCPPSGIMNG